jgi:hypothetical protein
LSRFSASSSSRRAALPVLLPVGEPKRFLEDVFGLGGVDGVQVDARLSPQRLPDSPQVILQAVSLLRLAVPAQGRVELAAQPGDVPQIHQKRRMSLQDLRRQGTDPGGQCVQASRLDHFPSEAVQDGRGLLKGPRSQQMRNCLRLFPPFGKTLRRAQMGLAGLLGG